MGPADLALAQAQAAGFSFGPAPIPWSSDLERMLESRGLTLRACVPGKFSSELQDEIVQTMRMGQVVLLERPDPQTGQSTCLVYMQKPDYVIP